MNTLEVIAARRSIRAFKYVPINEDIIHAILMAAIQAPSSKNRQPWRFIVVSNEKRAEMVQIFRHEIEYWKARGRDLGSSEQTAIVMEQAPVTIFVFYPDLIRQRQPYSEDQISKAVVDIQSIGASIQNMLLAAQHLGLGSLWIADVLFASEKLCNWLGEESVMIAAVSLGYADESPEPRPRRPINDLVRRL
jgi:nitroreductase